MNETALARQENDSTPFWLMDRMDDDLIKQELEGKMPDVLTYHFEDKGREIWGLSKAGVDEAKAELAKKGEVLRVLDVQFVDGEKDGKFIVKVGRYVISNAGQEVLLDTTAGFKKQDKKKKARDGREYDDPFWFESGGVKAQRNAFHSLIPKTIIQGVIEYAKQHGKVKEVKNSEHPQPEKQNETQGQTSFSKWYEGKSPITEKQGKLLYARLKNKNIPIDNFLGHFELAEIKNLPFENMNGALEWIDKQPEPTAGERDD